MNKSKLTKWLGLSVFGLLLLAVPTVSANASSDDSDNTTKTCLVNYVTVDGKKFVQHGGMVTSTFTLTGNDCHEQINLDTWTAPNGTDGRPFEAQRLFSSKSLRNLGAGTYSITVPAPSCYYQFDLTAYNRASTAGLTPYYPKATLVAWEHGGTRPCTATCTPTPSVTPTPTPSVTPTETPEVTPTPTPEVLGEATTLPQTGGEVLGGVIGLTSMTGAAVAYMRSRKIK